VTAGSSLFESVDQAERQDNAQQWRNLYFTRLGRTYWSSWLHPTEAAARAQSAEWLAESRAYIEAYGDDFCTTWSGARVPLSDFLCAIPMPWRD
jgi:hypothetical protein